MPVSNLKVREKTQPSDDRVGRFRGRYRMRSMTTISEADLRFLRSHKNFYNKAKALTNDQLGVNRTE